MGILSIAFSIFLSVILIGVSVGVIPVILIGLYILEKHLKNIFDSEGNRK